MIAASVRSIPLALLFCFVLKPSPDRAAAQSHEASEPAAVQVTMKNLMYHYTDPVAVHIVQLQGELLPTKPGTIVVFDDKNSFTIVLTSAETSISCTALAQVLNDNVFSAANSPIRNLSIESRNNQLIMKGKLHQKGDVSFETTGTLTVEGDGRVRLHTDHLKAAHLPLKGLFDVLGIEIAGMINSKKIQGISADKDDLIFNPEQVLPPPHILGSVSAVHIQGSDIVLTFGTSHAGSFASSEPGNYVALRHGEVQFNRLTMRDSDLVMIDMDPGDPFDFYIDHYQQQVAAGYTKITPEFGVRAFARDYNKLRTRKVQPTKQ
jgi:hypothetical protein